MDKLDIIRRLARFTDDWIVVCGFDEDQIKAIQSSVNNPLIVIDNFKTRPIPDSSLVYYKQCWAPNIKDVIYRHHRYGLVIINYQRYRSIRDALHFFHKAKLKVVTNWDLPEVRQACEYHQYFWKHIGYELYACEGVV
jgi:hypothetical protein